MQQHKKGSPQLATRPRAEDRHGSARFARIPPLRAGRASVPSSLPGSLAHGKSLPARFALRRDVRGGEGLRFGETSPVHFRSRVVLRVRVPSLSSYFASGAWQTRASRTQNQEKSSHYWHVLRSAETNAEASECILARPSQQTFGWEWSWEYVYQVSARNSLLGLGNARAKRQ